MTLQSLPALILVGIAGLAVVALAPSLELALVGIAIATIGASVAMAVVRAFLLRRRAVPAADVIMWWSHETSGDWQALDGGVAPTTVEDALTRLGGRTGEPATRLRIGYLLLAGRSQEADELLKSWSPADATDLVRRERSASAIALAQGNDDLTAVEAAIGALADQPERRRQTVFLAIERARRASIAARDPLPLLLSARSMLTPADVAIARQAYRLPLAARVRAVALVPFACFLVLAIIAIGYGTWAR
jgi:hypothetical protein